MYDPLTLAFSFPPYPKHRTKVAGEKPRWTLSGWLYDLSPWIGFDIWHVDPEKPGTGNRPDDSCGWFDRTPGEYLDAVTELLADKGDMQELRNAFVAKVFWRSAYLTGEDYKHKEAQGWSRLTPADALAAVTMVALRLERLRYWRLAYPATWWLRPFVRERDVLKFAADLALQPHDNLASAETPESLVKLTAAALNRRFRPWWRHPRWHVHHWKVNITLARNLRRMIQPCATCGKPLGFGYCPTNDGSGRLHHGPCLGHHGPVAAKPTG